MFEVQDLKYATLATVSRCGMVWFSEDVLSTDMIFNNFLARLRSIPLDEGEDEAQRLRKGKEDEGEEAASPMLQVGVGGGVGGGEGRHEGLGLSLLKLGAWSVAGFVLHQLLIKEAQGHSSYSQMCMGKCKGLLQLVQCSQEM